MLEKKLLSNAQKNPSKIALIYKTTQFTYGELINSIYYYSNYLRKLKKKSKILLDYKNSIEWIIYYFAIRYSGNYPVLVSNYFPKGKVNQIISESRVKFIISDRYNKKKNITFLKKINIHLSKKFEINSLLIKTSKIAKEIIYTSGSTGNPKGVILLLKISEFVAKMINKIVKVDKNSIELLSLPLSHSDGLARLKCMAYNGHTIVINDKLNNFGNFFYLLKKFKINGFFMVPSGIEILMKMKFINFGPIAKNLKFIELGSEKINKKTLKWLKKTFLNAKIYYHYGLTEASRSAFKIIKNLNMTNNIFTISPGIKFKIFDKLNKLCKKKQIGEIVLFGKNLLEDYVGQKNNLKFSKYGFKTGDLGKKISNKTFQLEGRVDKIKKINGLSINLNEIENKIMNYPKIKKSKCRFFYEKLSKSYKIKAGYFSNEKIDEKKLMLFLSKNLERIKLPAILKRERLLNV
jgi:long-chain acyl-CoA synthetase